jgi:hypothetical protein
MEKQTYSIGKGRPRPAYKPKDIHCSGCGAGLTVKDEHAELIVCDYCGSHLAVTSTEQKVLGKGSKVKQKFPLNLGDNFRHRGLRFEIIGRMAFIEEGDYTEMTRQYLLYNPRAGTRWLDEYKGHYSLSQMTHVMPKSDPFQCQSGMVLETHDDQEWVMEEAGIYELVYVDGALPWIAKIGDTVSYADFTEKSGSGKQYQVEKTHNEIEYSVGRPLDIEFMRRATGKQGLLKPTVRRIDMAAKRGVFMFAMIAGLLTLAVNGILLGITMTRGQEVLRQNIRAPALNGEAISKPFRIDSNIIKVSTTAAPALNNEWMSLDLAIVDAAENVIHVYDQGLSYYHGWEGGEKWTEGSQTKSSYIKVPNPGQYRLLLHGVSARGNKNYSSSTSHGIQIRVIDGARRSTFFIGSIVITVLIMVGASMLFSYWTGGYDDDEE